MRPSDRVVAVTLYRSLRRLALAHDRDPALKALLAVPQEARRVYQHELQEWRPIGDDGGSGQRAAAWHGIARAYLGGGSSYRPRLADNGEGRTESMAGFLRDTFDRRVDGDGLSARLDAGFSALSFLSGSLAAGAELPRVRVSPPLAWSSHGRDLPAAASVGPGSLLAAHATALCPSLGRAVVLLLEHEQDGRSLGLVINKPSYLTLLGTLRLLASHPNEEDALSGTALAPLEANMLHIGGPVPSPLLVLHPFGCLVEAAATDTSVHADAHRHAARVGAALRRIAPQTPAGGDGGGGGDGGDGGNGGDGGLYASPLGPQLLRGASALIGAGAARPCDFKVVLGSAVWGAGQLDGEWADADWFASCASAIRRADGPAATAIEAGGSAATEAAAEAAAVDASAWLRRLVLSQARPEELFGAEGAAVADVAAEIEAEIEAAIERQMWQPGVGPGAAAAESSLGPCEVASSGGEGAAAGAIEGSIGRASVRSEAPPSFGGAGRFGVDLAGVGVDDGSGGVEELSGALGAVPLSSSPLSATELLHEICDAEMVPEAGQHVWGALLSGLGGEYRGIAALACAFEEQCAGELSELSEHMSDYDE